MALRLSCLIHIVLLDFCLGCSARRPVTIVVRADDEISEGRDFVGALADKMPLWDADSLAKYEQAEIATVKADIAIAQTEADNRAFLEAVTRLRHDWEALLVLDKMLKKESLI